MVNFNLKSAQFFNKVVGVSTKRPVIHARCFSQDECLFFTLVANIIIVFRIAITSPQLMRLLRWDGSQPTTTWFVSSSQKK